jgi:dihydrofolate reductase
LESQKIILVAMTEDRLIGREGRIPWHIPEELRLFRELTVGHAVLMGRRTFESIGRPLPERRNIVLSRTLGPTPGVIVCADLRKGLAEGAAHGSKTFIIGGRQVYLEALPIADFMRISWIPGHYAGDVYFPPFSLSDWEEIDSRDRTGFRHATYRRRNGDAKHPDHPPCSPDLR